MVDTFGLGPNAKRCESSSLSGGTNKNSEDGKVDDE